MPSYHASVFTGVKFDGTRSSSHALHFVPDTIFPIHLRVRLASEFPVLVAIPVLLPSVRERLKDRVVISRFLLLLDLLHVHFSSEISEVRT